MNQSGVLGLRGGRVLIVDDDVRNRALLNDLLVSQGFEVTEAESGTAALAQVLETAPHAILLDVMMPGLNGFEVCRRLKADPATAAIPVLLVTAMHDRESRLQGIEAGANDFLTKPIDIKEVVLRTRNAVYTKQLHDRIQDDLLALRKLEKLRDNLTHMIVHDMRSPLMGISGNLDILEMNLGSGMEANNKQCLEEARMSASTLVEMIGSLLDVSRMESGEMPLHKESCHIKTVVEHAVQWLGGILRQTPVVIEAPTEEHPVVCDTTLIQRVVANLLANARKYSPQDASIRVLIQQIEKAIKICVMDQGPGIAPEYHARIFEKFGQVETDGSQKRYSTGLGLTFCKLAVEAHGGRIGVESTLGHGSVFWFTLPN